MDAQKNQVIPAINCPDFPCVEGMMNVAHTFLKDGGWLHLDVADARFTFNRTWGSPTEFKRMHEAYPQINFEIHLMVEDPENVFESWLDAGAKRIIIHFEALSRTHQGIPKDPSSVIERLKTECDKYGADCMLAMSPETSLDDIEPWADKFSFFQVLAVQPGLAGQKFFPVVLEKVRSLRSRFPDATIEVDGGINFETAGFAKEAGADIIVSASCIFEDSDPIRAYGDLQKIGIHA